MKSPATTRRATPQQLAKHLSISDSQVLILTKKGVIPTVVNEGRIYRYDIEEVDRVLAERAAAKAQAKAENFPKEKASGSLA